MRRIGEDHMIDIKGQLVNSGLPVPIGIESDNLVTQIVFAGVPNLGGAQLVTQKTKGRCVYKWQSGI